MNSQYDDDDKQLRLLQQKHILSQARTKRRFLKAGIIAIGAIFAFNVILSIAEKQPTSYIDTEIVEEVGNPDNLSLVALTLKKVIDETDVRIEEGEWVFTTPQRFLNTTSGKPGDIRVVSNDLPETVSYTAAKEALDELESKGLVDYDEVEMNFIDKFVNFAKGGRMYSKEKTREHLEDDMYALNRDAIEKYFESYPIEDTSALDTTMSTLLDMGHNNNLIHIGLTHVYGFDYDDVQQAFVNRGLEPPNVDRRMFLTGIEVSAVHMTLSMPPSQVTNE